MCDLSQKNGVCPTIDDVRAALDNKQIEIAKVQKKIDALDEELKNSSTTEADRRQIRDSQNLLRVEKNELAKQQTVLLNKLDELEGSHGNAASGNGAAGTDAGLKEIAADVRTLTAAMTRLQAHFHSPPSASATEMGHMVTQMFHRDIRPDPGAGPGILTAAQFETLQSLHTEKSMTTFLFPLLRALLPPRRCLVSSEDHQWLLTGTERREFAQKPDLFVCHPAFYHQENDDPLRPGVVRGKPELPCQFDVGIMDAKMDLTTEALGELAIHAEHLCRQTCAPVVRTALLSKATVWLIEFASNVPVVRVLINSWTEPGSAAAFTQFFSSRSIRRIGDILDDACAEMKSGVTPGRSFLGAGGTGFVFKISEGRTDYAVKIVERSHGAQSLVREKAALEEAPGDCVVKPVRLIVRTPPVPNAASAEADGAALVLAHVGEVPPQTAWSDGLLLLAKMHSKGWIHGDPRRPNLLHVSSLGYRWCDMVGSAQTTEAYSKYLDVITFAKSFGTRDIDATVLDSIRKYSTGELPVTDLLEQLRPYML